MPVTIIIIIAINKVLFITISVDHSYYLFPTASLRTRSIFFFEDLWKVSNGAPNHFSYSMLFLSAPDFLFEFCFSILTHIAISRAGARAISSSFLSRSLSALLSPMLFSNLILDSLSLSNITLNDS